MRSRSIVLSAALVGALALGVLLAAATAGSAHQPRTQAICPQSSDLTTPTCCGPPIDSSDTTPCCQTAVCPASRLTIASSADPAEAGSKLVISGELVNGSSTGRTIELWQRLPGASAFTQTLSTNTAAGGTYSFTLAKGKVLTNRSWYVTGDGLTSPTIDQGVDLALTLTSVIRHGRAVLSGKVTPATKGSVELESLGAGGRWHVLGHARLSRSSRFSWRTSYTPQGRVKVRAAVLQNADHLQSFSRLVRARVLRGRHQVH